MKSNLWAECMRCNLRECPVECFNKHPGSTIAILKILRKNSKNVIVIDEKGGLHDINELL
jgi:hypothetical protein